MTETVPFLEPSVTARKNGEPVPTYARRQLGFGWADDVAGSLQMVGPQIPEPPK